LRAPLPGIHPPAGANDFVNHSCDQRRIERPDRLVAIRDIQPGEVCFDYAMSDSLPTMSSSASAVRSCRGRVTGDDWETPGLWERYDGYFSPYLQRHVDRLKKRPSIFRLHSEQAADCRWLTI
jgi:hypothetical protein